jgi:uncharacterized lipoprotein YddW (UPF0748 family)
MKQRFLLYILLLATLTVKAQPKYEVRAVWLTTIGGIDWPSVYAHDGMGIETQKRQLTDMLDRLKKINVNTVLLQTRVRATTIYPSDIEPWDGCLSGKPGVSPGYDALQFAIDECHRRGMELHAWMVTIPVGKWNTYGCQQLRRRYPSLIMKIGDEGYMNPESPTTANYLADICEEVTRKYDIDGIHLDYIRYPETWHRSKSATYITDIVRTIQRRVKLHKPWVKMSCSPIGKYDNLSRYSSKGWNALSRVAQDAQGWLRDGLMDQLYPMMYFRDNNFYPFAIDWQENSYGRTVASGLGIYLLHPREGNWPLAEIQRQVSVTRSIGMGHCYFRAKFLLDNIKGVYDFMATADRHPALTPPMTWAQSLPPTAPTRLKVQRTAKGDRMTWSGAKDCSDGPYLLYNIYAAKDSQPDIADPANLIATRHPWQHLFVPRTAATQRLQYAVTAIDRYGNESLPKYENSGLPAMPSALLPNDGMTLQPDLKEVGTADLLLICTLQGTAIMASRGKRLNIRQLPEGMYELKSITPKGFSHRLGFFAVKRNKKTAGTWRK